MTKFIHLRNHSDFSLLQGAMNIAKLVEIAAAHNMPALALTDRNNLFGAYEFSTTATAAGIQPLIAIEAIMDDSRNLDARAEPPSPEASPPPASAGEGLAGKNHSKLILIVQNQQGYDNLRKLVSDVYSYNDGHSEICFAWGDIAAHHQGLICLSGGTDGVIGQAILNGQEHAAEKLARHLQGIFGDRFYLEIARHGLTQENISEAAFLKLADKLNIPIVATNDCHFATKDMHEAQDILSCIGGGYGVGEQDRPRLSPEHYFKSSQDMERLFKDLPDALQNSVQIAKRCGFALERTEASLPTYKKLQGRSEFEALQALAKQGLQMRLGNDISEADRKAYEKRLQYELKVINEMNFCGYFLIVADFTQWSKHNDIPVGPGRGSGAGSLVSWALMITDLDPLQYGLLFERFLNPERISMPDFDIDFCQEKREQVIQYVQNEYGPEKVAQIATFGKLQARAVLRDVGRVLGMPYGDVDRICKMVPNTPADPKTLPQVMQSEPLLRQEYNNKPQVKRLVDIAIKLEGLYRHVGTHAAGIVIGDKELSDIIPLYRDPRSNMMVTQFSMKNVESVGLVKFDFLGLKTLTVIDKAIAFIKENRGEDLDINKISLTDKSVFQFLCDKSAVGIFQLESSGMQDVMRQMRPDRLEDLIAIVALYRPGPMKNIPSYINRKHGNEKTIYLHPLLEEILEETYGIAVYQEQVMQMAQILAGYTLGQADLLRRAMGKKDAKEMARERKKFTAGALQNNNIPEHEAMRIFDEMESFAGYGFNKTHAAAYALLAYQTAYLKVHYGTEFMAASLCLDNDDTDRLEILMEECRQMEIDILPADINRSQVNFSIDNENGKGDEKKGGAIRYGLSALKGVGEGAAEKIIAAREDAGDFANLYDFFERCDCKTLNKTALESLVHAGAFDSLNPNRRQNFMGLDMLRNYGKSYQERKNSNQSFLFGESVEANNRPLLPDADDWTNLQKSKGELEAVGFYLSSHPLSSYGERLDRLGIKYASEIMSPEFEGRATIAAVIMSIRIIRTRQGKKICFIRAGDGRGYFELTAYEEVLERYYGLLQEHRLIYAEVMVKQQEGRGNRVQLLSLEDLDEKFGNVSERLTLMIDDIDALDSLKSVFNEHSQPGKGSVYVIVRDRDLSAGVGDIILDLGVRLNLTEDLRRAVKSLAGVQEVN